MKLKAIWILTAVLVLHVAVKAQFYFGQNKIQYTAFAWKVLSTAHFSLYFYEQESEVADIAAAAAEESYAALSDKFNHHIFKKIPLIIYSAPTFFAQTNVIPSLLPENVAGFTEFYKGRMVVPFNGTIGDFRRVIRHELAHSFMYDKILSNISEHRKTNYYGPPLWFTEGLAELWSRPWDTEAEMILADMSLEGNLRNIEDLDDLSGSFFMYKFGESFCHFISQQYGEDKIQMLFENWWKANSFGSLFKLTLGKSLKDVGDEWVYEMKKHNFPKLEQSDLPSKVSTAITEKQFAVKPAPLRIEYEGVDDWIVYKANKLGYSGIYMRSPSTHRELTLVKGERSPAFESLHLLQSKIAASADGRIAFISKRFERDVLYIYDVCARSITATYEFPQLYQLASPSWSRDDRTIVLSGATYKGIYDLYTFSLVDSSLTQLNDDVYFDTEPVFDPDGNIVFSSDRSSFGYEGHLNLFRLSPADSVITPITYGKFNDRSPEYSGGTDLMFTSDRNGSSNIYLQKPGGSLYRVTNFATGAFDPVRHGNQLVFAGYQNFSFSLYSLPLDSSTMTPVEYEPPTFSTWNPEYLKGKPEEAALEYANEYSFDVAQSAISYDAVFGSIGGFQTVFSDMLGNQLYYVLISNSASTKDELLKSFSAGVTYVNKSRRLNYGLGVFHLYDKHYDDYDGYYTERQSGAHGLISYPLSKFTRVETSAFVRHSFKKWLGAERQRHAVLSTNYVSIVHDNSLWDISGPIDGVRYNATVGLTTDFYSGRFFNRLASVDLRHYLRIGKFSAFATRAFGFTSVGEEPQRIYLGGSWSLRGYDRRQFYARKVVLLSNELRFPLIDNLFIGFPFGRIGFQAIRGAVFVDAGSGWNDKFDHLSGSFGAGARVALGYLAVLRFDLAKRTDFKRVDSGVVFDFFFGWNF
jgi:hypothetical protein